MQPKWLVSFDVAKRLFEETHNLSNTYANEIFILIRTFSTHTTYMTGQDEEMNQKKNAHKKRKRIEIVNN